VSALDLLIALTQINEYPPQGAKILIFPGRCHLKELLMSSLHLPPGAASVAEDDHPTHPFLIDYEDGSRTRAISIGWSETPAPSGTFALEDERDIDAHGQLQKSGEPQ